MAVIFKNYVWIPHDLNIANKAKYRADADDTELWSRGLTIEDVTYEDRGMVYQDEYLTIFTVKSFLWLRRLFRGIF